MRSTESHASTARLLGGGLTALLLTLSAPARAEEPSAPAGADAPAPAASTEAAGASSPTTTAPAAAPSPDAPPAPKESGGPGATATAAPPPAVVPSPPDKPAEASAADRGNRHTGFHARVELGPGHMSASASVPGANLSFGGFSAMYSLALGAAVVEDLIIAGDLWALTATAPDFTVNGQTAGTSSDISASLAGFGPNVTYYLMPANVFFSATPSISRLVLENAQESTRSGTSLGFATRLAVGKEWWVAKHLGIGVAGNLHLGLNQDELTTPTSKTTFTWTTLGGGLTFSASYN